MVYEYPLETGHEGFYDITAEIEDALEKSGVKSGLCTVFSPHTTAGITINENADADVRRDLLFALDRVFPDFSEFRHAEGNSAASVGSSASIIIDSGRLILGRWQGVYFAEFDGPRSRRFYVKIIEG